METDATHAPFEPGSILAGKYRIDRTIAEGGMGYVVAATHLHLDQPVAVKFLRGDVSTGLDALARFTREAKAAAQLRSEYVARVLDAGVADDGTPYMVMEYLEGESLARSLSLRGPMDVPSAVEYLIQACEALAEAHARGIVHRDIKPYNLFLIERSPGRYSIKVLDFGISKFAFSDPSNIVTGAIIGSPCYMSPEQLRSSASVDHRTDIWSLGATLHELLAGCAPFDATLTLPELVTAILESPAPSLDELLPGLVSPELASVVRRCLSKDREARFASAGELAMALLPFATPRARLAAEQAAAMKPVFPIRVPPSATQLPTTVTGSRLVVQPPMSVTGRFAPPPMRDEATSVPPVVRSTPPGPEREASGQQATPIAVTIHPPRPEKPRDEGEAAPFSASAWVVATTVAAAAVVAFVAVSLAGREAPPASAAPQPSAATVAPMGFTAARPSEGSPPAASAPLPSASDRVELLVRAEPSQARILVDGEQVENPFRASYPKGNTNHHIVARAWGYESKSEDVALTSDMIVSIALERAPMPVPQPAAAPVARPPSAPRRPIATADPPPAPAPAASPEVDPSGGHAPVRAIETKDPY